MTIFLDYRAAYTTAAAALGNATMSAMQWIPENLALISTGVGLVVGVLAIRGQMLSYRKTKLEIELLEHQKLKDEEE